jgi:nicotinamide mononucleotide adenylyltransferase
MIVISCIVLFSLFFIVTIFGVLFWSICVITNPLHIRCTYRVWFSPDRDVEYNELKWQDVIPNIDEIYTIAEWLDCVNMSIFTDYNGYASYATESKHTNTIVSPSDVIGDHDKFKKQSAPFTHMVWFSV